MAKLKTPTLGFAFHFLPDDRPPSGAEFERRLLQNLQESEGTSKDALWNLARLYSKTKRHDRAFECVNKLASLATNIEEVASCWLAMGQLSEQLSDYEAAARYYRTALNLNQDRAPTWYWIHNNLGYSLIKLGQFQEAATYLKAALRIDSTWPNAFKNLGLAVQAMNENEKAAECFVAATRVNAADGRAPNHLEELVALHPELLAEDPALKVELDACRCAVGRATSDSVPSAIAYR
jgi:tetratricopeptide (TPR) repeat protein